MCWQRSASRRAPCAEAEGSSRAGANAPSVARSVERAATTLRRNCSARRQALPRAGAPVSAGGASAAGSGRGTRVLATVPDEQTGAVGGLGVSVPSRTASASSGLPRIVFLAAASPASSTHRAPSCARPGSTRRCAHQRPGGADLSLVFSNRTRSSSSPARRFRSVALLPLLRILLYAKLRSRSRSRFRALLLSGQTACVCVLFHLLSR